MRIGMTLPTALHCSTGARRTQGSSSPATAVQTTFIDVYQDSEDFQSSDLSDRWRQPASFLHRRRFRPAHSCPVYFTSNGTQRPARRILRLRYCACDWNEVHRDAPTGELHDVSRPCND